ncbi:MAG TPA: GntR family transcriptional regulator [Nocardioidaceae bacterium]|nr:GntR family transcriptional regulator [Nocardioidaceae bacterium]
MYDSLQIEQSTTVERVVDELRRALFDGELAPGTPLREVALAEAMHVSRGTIREALGALVAEGLAVREPNRGVAVNALSRTDVRDVCQARAALETAGVRRWASAKSADKAALRQALADYSRAADAGNSSADLTAAHLGVHRALVGLTGSERLLAMSDSLSAEVRLALAHVARVRRNSREQVSAHRDLVGMLEQGDIDTAVHELEGHLAHAESSMIDAIARRHRKAPH